MLSEKACQRPKCEGIFKPYKRQIYCSEECSNYMRALSQKTMYIKNYERNKESNRIKSRDFERRNRYKIRAKKYGISFERFNELLALQGNSCAICRKVFNDQNTPRVDHDHRCCPGGKNNKVCGACVRGLLCGKCNSALGMLYDDPVLLQAGSEYLKSFMKDVEHAL